MVYKILFPVNNSTGGMEDGFGKFENLRCHCEVRSNRYKTGIGVFRSRVLSPLGLRCILAPEGGRLAFQSLYGPGIAYPTAVLCKGIGYYHLRTLVG